MAAFFPHAVRSSDLELAASQLKIDASHVRVALSRLRSKGTVELESRGSYRLSSQVAFRQTALGPWTDRLERLRAWDGDYLIALSGWLPKSDRKARRNQEKALSTLGFSEVQYGFAIRPNNLNLSTAEVFDILLRLGFNEKSEVFLGSDLSFKTQSLWEPPNYMDYTKSLEDSYHTLAQKGGVDAAVESFKVANKYVRKAVMDPLLPDQWIDKNARFRFWKKLMFYDTFGRNLWKTQVWEAAGISIGDSLKGQ